jgi:hypothetical protein
MRASARKAVLIILAASVIFAAAEPILSPRAMAISESEMVRILKNEGDIRISGGSLIPDLDLWGEITKKINDVTNLITYMLKDIPSSGFYIDDILKGMLGQVGAMLGMIPKAIGAIFENFDEVLGKIFTTLGEAIWELVKLLFSPKDIGDWLKDMLGRIGTVKLGNPPLNALPGLLLDRLLDYYDAMRVELGPLLDNVLIAEVIWLASKYAVGAIADKLGPWWVDCLAMLAIDAEDAAIAILKFEELVVFENWDEDIRHNYARDHEALASAKKVPLSMPAKLGGLYDGLSAGGAFSFAANPAGALRGAYGGYRTERPEELYIDDYRDVTRSAIDYAAQGFAKAAEAEVSDFHTLLSRIPPLSEAANGADGYRKAHQARNRIRVFAAQEAVNMRLDVARQMDMMNREAMDEEQKHNDLVSAFERSVGTWRPFSSAVGY